MKPPKLELVRTWNGPYNEDYFNELHADPEPEPSPPASIVVIPKLPEDRPPITGRDADLANAILGVSATFATSVRFDHTRNQWHILNAAGHWAPDRTEQIHDLLEHAARAAMSIDDLDPDEIVSLTKLLDRSKAEAVLKTIARKPPIAMSGNEFDRDPFLLGVTNGVVDLRNGTVRQGRPDDMVSRSTGLEYDPDAECPRFEEFLGEIMSGDAERITFLRRWLGYSLLGFTREQKFSLWVGVGQNGKGVLKRIVRHVVGDYGLELPSTLYMRTKHGSARADAPRPELVELQGVRVALGSEPEGGQLNEELIKAHSGEDEIRARRLYANAILRFYPSHTINLLTNLAPAVEDVGSAMRRRLLVIPFDEVFSGSREDLNLYDALRAESVGILALLVREAVAYLEDGLGSIPVRVQMANEEYLDENNPLSEWMAARIVKDPEARTAHKTLFEDYRSWSIGQTTISATSFGMRLSALGYPLAKQGGRGEQVKARVGLRLRSLIDDE